MQLCHVSSSGIRFPHHRRLLCRLGRPPTPPPQTTEVPPPPPRVRQLQLRPRSRQLIPAQHPPLLWVGGPARRGAEARVRLSAQSGRSVRAPGAPLEQRSWPGHPAQRRQEAPAAQTPHPQAPRPPRLRTPRQGPCPSGRQPLTTAQGRQPRRAALRGSLRSRAARVASPPAMQDQALGSISPSRPELHRLRRRRGAAAGRHRQRRRTVPRHPRCKRTEPTSA